MKTINIPAPTKLTIRQGSSYDFSRLCENAVKGIEGFTHKREQIASSTHLSLGHKYLCGFWIPTWQRSEVWTNEQKKAFIQKCRKTPSFKSVI